ncbi:MAG: T9SS type A sorting domain-containing protein, partial [Chitinophagaceae bacterium]|nr:T9SS type A sorting domain-containing protein [Chitinophagaceae bacterium]
SDKFVIRLDGAAGSGSIAEIVTMDGKIWKRIHIISDRTIIDCAGWSRGLYMVRIKGPDGLLLTEKIVLH